jgi:hypothetical protein
MEPDLQDRSLPGSSPRLPRPRVSHREGSNTRYFRRDADELENWIYAKLQVVHHFEL